LQKGRLRETAGVPEGLSQVQVQGRHMNRRAADSSTSSAEGWQNIFVSEFPVRIQYPTQQVRASGNSANILLVRRFIQALVS
jgi:hypothetical protein